MLTGTQCHGSGPIWLDHSTVAVHGSSIDVTVYFDGSDFAVPFCTSIYAAVPGLSAGTYGASFTDPAYFSRTYPMGSVTVRDAGPAASPQFRGLSGNWFDPAQSGWGVNLVQGNSGALFAAWMAYTIDYSLPAGSSGKPFWVVMSSGRWLTPTKFRGLFYHTTGPYLSSSFNPAAVKALPAGVGTLEFTSSTEVRFEGVIAFEGYPHTPVVGTLRRFAF